MPQAKDAFMSSVSTSTRSRTSRSSLRLRGENMTYRTYISALLQTPEVRALGGTFLYGTSYDLFNEYLSEKSTSAICVRRLDGNFEDQSEAEFYILLDFLTFVPFGLAGREALEGKGICAEEVAYRYALLLLGPYTNLDQTLCIRQQLDNSIRLRRKAIFCRCRCYRF